MTNTYAVIMAGGVGSRFWPASRSGNPKQLLDLTGSGQTMIAATVARLSPAVPPERVIVVTSKSILAAVVAALPEIPPENILAEPTGRNTAPCIGWAALHVLHRDPDAVMAVMPSDHLIEDRQRFHEAFAMAVASAEENRIVTFGIRPSGPETGFGYIEIEPGTDVAVRSVLRFVEKPSLEKAREYVANGNFVWNSGMFFFRARRILDEMSVRMPQLSQGLDRIGAAIRAGNEPEILAEVFPALPSESIDYGIMEKADDILCVPVDFGWSDLGSWDAAWAMSKKDSAGNAMPAGSIALSTNGCLVRAPEGKVISLVGLKDLIIVDTGDALMICHRDAAQDVKKVVEIVGKSGRGDLL